jgi:hypothetical protein
MNIRNRISEHVTVKARELVPHPLNFRAHPREQRQALADSYQEIGFARSLLGYRLPDGRIQLIDGHLRAEYDPDMDVVVEVLDVTEEEARHLLLTIDPLAEFARTNRDVHRQLRERTRTQSEALQALWEQTQQTQSRLTDKFRQARPPAEQFLVLIECAGEEQQVELLRRFQGEGLRCRAVLG